MAPHLSATERSVRHVNISHDVLGALSDQFAEQWRGGNEKAVPPVSLWLVRQVRRVQITTPRTCFPSQLACGLTYQTASKPNGLKDIMGRERLRKRFLSGRMPIGRCPDEAVSSNGSLKPPATRSARWRSVVGSGLAPVSVGPRAGTPFYTFSAST